MNDFIDQQTEYQHFSTTRVKDLTSSASINHLNYANSANRNWTQLVSDGFQNTNYSIDIFS